MKRLVIFDLDGTLLNTIADLGTACNVALTQLGYPTHKISHYPKLVGNGVNRLIYRALPEDQQNEANIARMREYFIPYYNAHNCVYTTPYEGIPEVLRTLKSQHIHLAVASNKYNTATQAIVNHYFPNTFDIVLGERPNIPRKPNPQIVFDILNTIKIKPEEVLYVGDSDVDIRTAQAAGIEHIACTWGFCTEEKLRQANPDHIIHQPKDILSLALS